MIKKLHFKKLLLMALMLVGAGSAWADKSILTPTSDNIAPSDDHFTVTYGGQGSNPYWTNNVLRLYAKNTITFASKNGETITGIAFTANVNANKNGVFPGSITANTGDVTPETFSEAGEYEVEWSDATGTTEVVLTITGTAGNIEVTSYEVTYTASTKVNANFNASDITMFTGETRTSFYTIADGYDGTLNFASSNEDVAKVESGVLKAIGPGEAEITVTAAATENYLAVNGTFTVTVNDREAVDPVGPANLMGKFVKVTKTDDITDGNYLIVYETDGVAFDGSLGTLDAVNNTIEVDIEAGEIEADNDNLGAVFTIDVTNGTLKSASGYYIGVSSNNNGLKQIENASTYTHSFSINDGGNAVITALFEGSTMTLRYNSASNQQRFRYYTNNGQKAIQLYKYVPGQAAESFDVTIDENKGYKTLVSTVNFTTPEGVTAYIVTARTEEKVTLTAIDEVPAGEPVILEGSGEVTLTVIDEAEAVTGNLLQISDETTGTGVFVLAKPSGKEVGFYRWTGGMLGAGRVYLPAIAGSRSFLPFSFGEVTEINSVNHETTTNNSYFDLQGRHVAQPTKGLYIVNGKKVIIK